MKLLDFVVRESIIVDLQATGKEQAIREMVGSLHGAGGWPMTTWRASSVPFSGREELGSTGIGQGRGGSAYAASDASAPGGNGRVVAPRRRFRGLGRRAGRYLLSAGLAPEPAWRPSQSLGEYLATLERRAVRQFPASGSVTRERGGCARAGRPPLALKERRRAADLAPRRRWVAERSSRKIAFKPRERPRPCDRPMTSPFWRVTPIHDNLRSSQLLCRRRKSVKRTIDDEQNARKRPPEGFSESEDTPVVACPRPRPIEPPMSHDPTVARCQVELTNSLGLHMRPANKFVELASKFQSEIRVLYNGNGFNGKSILDLTSLAAECGTRLDVEGAGPMLPRPSRPWPIWSLLSSTRMRTGSQPRSNHARSRLHERPGPRIPRPALRAAPVDIVSGAPAHFEVRVNSAITDGSTLRPNTEFAADRSESFRSQAGLRLPRRSRMAGNRQAQVCSTLGQRGSFAVSWIEPARRVSLKVCSSEGHDKSQ